MERGDAMHFIWKRMWTHWDAPAVREFLMVLKLNSTDMNSITSNNSKSKSSRSINGRERINGTSILRATGAESFGFSPVPRAEYIWLERAMHSLAIAAQSLDCICSEMWAAYVLTIASTATRYNYPTHTQPVSVCRTASENVYINLP